MPVVIDSFALTSANPEAPSHCRPSSHRIATETPGIDSFARRASRRRCSAAEGMTGGSAGDADATGSGDGADDGTSLPRAAGGAVGPELAADPVAAGLAPRVAAGPADDAVAPGLVDGVAPTSAAAPNWIPLEPPSTPATASATARTTTRSTARRTGLPASRVSRPRGRSAGPSTTSCCPPASRSGPGSRSVGALPMTVRRYAAAEEQVAGGLAGWRPARIPYHFEPGDHARRSQRPGPHPRGRPDGRRSGHLGPPHPSRRPRRVRGGAGHAAPLPPPRSRADREVARAGPGPAAGRHAPRLEGPAASPRLVLAAVPARAPRRQLGRFASRAACPRWSRRCPAIRSQRGPASGSTSCATWRTSTCGGPRPTLAEEYEDALIDAFAAGVPTAEAAALPGGSAVLPWASLRSPSGARKVTGITNPLLPQAKAPEPPAHHADRRPAGGRGGRRPRRGQARPQAGARDAGSGRIASAAAYAAQGSPRKVTEPIYLSPEGTSGSRRSSTTCSPSGPASSGGSQRRVSTATSRRTRSTTPRARSRGSSRGGSRHCRRSSRWPSWRPNRARRRTWSWAPASGSSVDGGGVGHLRRQLSRGELPRGPDLERVTGRRGPHGPPGWRRGHDRHAGRPHPLPDPRDLVARVGSRVGRSPPQVRRRAASAGGRLPSSDRITSTTPKAIDGVRQDAVQVRDGSAG